MKRRNLILGTLTAAALAAVGKNAPKAKAEPAAFNPGMPGMEGAGFAINEWGKMESGYAILQKLAAENGANWYDHPGDVLITANDEFVPNYDEILTNHLRKQEWYQRYLAQQVLERLGVKWVYRDGQWVKEL